MRRVRFPLRLPLIVACLVLSAAAAIVASFVAIDARQQAQEAHEELAVLREKVEGVDVLARTVDRRTARETERARARLARLIECVPEIVGNLSAVELYIRNPEVGFTPTYYSRACSAVIYGSPPND
jgi:hypothetical protein